MTEALKLTAYLAERERAGGGFLADTLLDLYGSRGVATSIALRGITGFGPRNILRTDESLSLSEDLPVVLTATDTPDVIAPLADDAAVLIGRGLITVERAQLIGASFPHHEGDVRLTVVLGRRQRIGGVPAHVAVTEIMFGLGFAGAIAYLGVDGTIRGERRRARFFSRNADVPVMVLAVGTAEQAAAAVAELAPLPAQLTAQRIRVCTRSGRLLDHPHALPEVDAEGRGLFQKLMVFTDEDARHDGQPIHRALVRRLRESGHAGGATVLRGLWGYTGDGPPHGDRMFALARRVPVATVTVDTPANIARSFEIVNELTAEHGLVTSEVVSRVSLA